MSLSSRPYLLRALYEWLVDNHLTIYVMLDAGHPQVKVPQQYVKQGQIVLNISPEAVRGLTLDDALSFSARFGGVPMQIYAPIEAVLAIYAPENPQWGYVFGHEPVIPSPEETKTQEEASLSLLSNQETEQAPLETDQVDTKTTSTEDTNRPGRAHLKVIK